MRNLARLALLAAFAALGCGAQGALTEEPKTLASLDEQCVRDPPSGYENPTGKTFTSAVLTGRQLLSLVKPSYAGTFVPSASGAASTPLEVTTSYSNGAVTCGPVQCSCDPPGPCSVDRCSAQSLSVAFDVTFHTSDGAFDESLAATATARQADGTVELSATLPVASLHGSYAPAVAGARSLVFQLTVKGDPIVSGSVQELAPDGHSGGGGAIH